MNNKYSTNSDKETLEFGEKFANDLRPGDAVCLIGELGAGKTTFVKGIAKGFGITKTITSPTFVLMRQYSVANNLNGISKLYHLDLYRLKEKKEIENIGIEDFLEDKEGIIIIEWPELLLENLDKKYVLNFIYKNDNVREISITKK